MRRFWMIATALAVVGLATASWAQDEPDDTPTPVKGRLTIIARPGQKDDAKIFPNGAPASGDVFIGCTLTAEGRVADCAVTKEDPPHPALTAAAMQEVNLFRYKPTDSEGQSVAGRKVVLHQFYLAPGDSNPDWMRRPTASSIASVFPVRALKENKSGLGVISCELTVEGGLDRCRVHSESPEGYGFGGAALLLSSQFLMKPKIRGGVPVRGAVRIPITFKNNGGGPVTVSKDRVIADPPWATTPSAEQVKAVFPARASDVPFGQAAMRCEVNDKGGLFACQVTSELPANKGFGAAAKSLAPSFTLRFAPDEVKILRDLVVDVPVRFRNPAATDPNRLTDPRWVSTLSADGATMLYPKAARDQKVATGLGVVDCMATAEGGLTDCRVAREDPPALGFGEAAMKASTVMKMNPWSKTGEPVEGRRLSIPIRLALPKDTVETPAAP